MKTAVAAAMNNTLKRELLPLRYSADWRAIMFVGVLFGMYAAQYAGVLRHPALFAATCVLSFIALIVRHNSIHCPLFTRARWNTAFDLLLSIITVQATDGVVAIHNERHHEQNHSEQDCVRSTLVRHRWNWVNLLTFFFAAASRARRKKSAHVREWRMSEPLRYRKYLIEECCAIGLLAVLAIFDWKATLLYLAAPVLAGHWCIVTINLLQHQDCDTSSAFNHSRNVTGRFVNWLFLNNGFHAAHHLEPERHWSELPELHRRVVEPNSNRDLNVNSLAVAIWRQFFGSRKSDSIQ